MSLSAGWLGALFQTWLSACLIRCGFISSLMRVWARSASRSTIKVHRLKCWYHFQASFSKATSQVVLLSIRRPVSRLPFLALSKEAFLAGLWDWSYGPFIDTCSKKKKKSISKYFAWLNPLLFPIFSLFILRSCSPTLTHRNWQRELWWPWYSSVWLPRGQWLSKWKCSALWMPVRIRAHRREDDNLPEQQSVVG